MFRILAAAAALVLGLAGCSLGIAPGSESPARSYKLAVNYQDAYKTAEAQARMCLVGKDAYSVVGNLDTSSRKGVVRVTAPFTDNDIVRVDVSAIDEKNSDVRIAMWGRGTWNGDAVVAMRDAIRFGLPSCTSFMPSDTNDPVQAPR